MSKLLGSDEGLSVEISRRGLEVTLSLCGALDAPGAERLGQAFDSLQLFGETPLLLDLSQLTFIASAGLRAVLRIYGRCLKHRHELQIAPAPPNVQRVFALTKAADVLPFCGEANTGAVLAVA